MEVLELTKKITYEEYYKLEDENRYEILEGELKMVPAPSFYHQIFSTELFLLIGNYVKKKNLGMTFHPPFDVILDSENVVQPDLTFISKENYGIIQERGAFGSPDLVVEIVSPSSEKMDKVVKKQIYQDFKIKEYWIVEPKEKSIQIFTLEEGSYSLFSSQKGTEKVGSKLLDGLEIEINEIFNLKKFK